MEVVPVLHRDLRADDIEIGPAKLAKENRRLVGRKISGRVADKEMVGEPEASLNILSHVDGHAISFSWASQGPESAPFRRGADEALFLPGHLPRVGGLRLALHIRDWRW